MKLKETGKNSKNLEAKLKKFTPSNVPWRFSRPSTKSTDRNICHSVCSFHHKQIFGEHEI